MAALQNAAANLRPALPTTTSSLNSPKPFCLSFSTTTAFNPLRLSSSILSSRTPGRGSLGARMIDTAATRYATALAELANSNATLDTTASDVEKLSTLFSDQQVFDFFVNPVIGTDKKRDVLDEIVKSSSLQPHTANFLNLLIDADRIDLIKDIVKEFERVYNKLTDTELAIVTSVVKLENDHLAQIAKGVQRLTGAKNVRIKTMIEPSLVAGFTIRYGDGNSKLVDMSVKTQLEEIAAQLDLGDVQLAPV